MSEGADKPSWLSECLKEEIEEALEARDFSPFAGEVLKKIEVEVEASLSEPFVAAASLRAEVEQELESRSPHWSAFTKGVLREIDREERAEARQPLVDRAVGELRRDVETELERAEPQFEHRFQRDLSRQLRKSGPSLYERISAFFSTYFEGWRAGAGFAAAVAAVFLLIIAAPRIEPPPDRVMVPREDRGSMVVKEVSFEGRVMVIEGEGVTFVYLSDS